MSTHESPKRKCTVEVKLHIHRWQEESDLEPQEIIDAIDDAVEEYFELKNEDEEQIEFDSDLGKDE